MLLDLIASRFELEGDGDYAPVAGNRATGLPTSSQRGTPPGVPATNRTESVALSLTDTDLGGGNFVSQIYWNRSRDTFGGEPNPIASFRSEEHTSELQSLMRISYAVFCLKKK